MHGMYTQHLLDRPFYVSKAGKEESGMWAGLESLSGIQPRLHMRSWGILPGHVLSPPPIRYAPQVLRESFQSTLSPGLLASTYETEIRPWERGGLSALSGAGPGPAVWPEGIVGSAELPLAAVYMRPHQEGSVIRGKVWESPVLDSVRELWSWVLLRQWAQRTVCSSWWGLPCVWGWSSGRECVDSKH